MGSRLPCENHGKAARHSAEHRWLAAQRYFCRTAGFAHRMDSALLSRLLATCAQRASALPFDARGLAGDVGGDVGLGRLWYSRPPSGGSSRWAKIAATVVPKPEICCDNVATAGG